MNWMKKCMVALICLLPFSAQAAKIEIVEVKSASMDKKVEVVVVCPDVADTKDCPVVYLLHGHGGNARQWITFKPELPRLADEKGIYLYVRMVKIHGIGIALQIRSIVMKHLFLMN